MRPRGFFVILDWPNRPVIVEGYKAARELTPGRCYIRRDTHATAEEFAAWWEYEHPAGRSVNTTE
jgi:hypothetical protein